MKKFLVLFAAVIVLTACGAEESKPPSEQIEGEKSTFTVVNELEGVAMDVKEETVSSTGVIVVFRNTTDSEYTYGEEYYLEKRVGDDWTQLPIIVDGEWGFPAIGYPLPAYSSKEMDVTWEKFYGEMDPGEYRVVKSVTFSFTGGFEHDYLAAPFMIE